MVVMDFRGFSGVFTGKTAQNTSKKRVFGLRGFC